ncbi:hypothetical protein Mal64_25720 [Pseudobythopirellula maris]|uniref:Uncharacterized protein n=1 Tax=Pseudobythopirellula maris TaxID=2527991 RepID=A0A5C5ZPD6_9BACT|nr:hypothetical protein [Pseudobythopirellula maris]TWT89080.1 hypothetical protein Mal64_25720 [Pseudobythopirellula maris]
MPNTPKTNPLQTLTRLAIMLGTLAVGSMAAYRYGPPAEQLAEWLDQGVEAATAALGGDTPPAELVAIDGLPLGTAEESAAAPSLPSGELLADTTSSEPWGTHRDSQVTPASALAPIANAPPAATGAEQTLQALGAVQLETTPWGDGGTLHRAKCVVPHDGARRVFDAFGATPEAAAEALAVEVRAWSVGER